MTPSKFSDPETTATGEARARVAFGGVKTLWFNTGTLCNIECVNCYIESSPTNDRLVYLTQADILPYLDELDAAGETGVEIGLTGGEPFMAPEILAIIQTCLARGHRVLVLTNAMKPMMRPRIKAGLSELRAEYEDRLTLRVSLDHYTAEKHDEERGHGSFDATMTGLEWLNAEGFQIDIAGRTLWHEVEDDARAGYADLFSSRGLRIDASDSQRVVLFPEMSLDADPPEITTQCWTILDKRPEDQMCASQRMVVKRKGASAPVVLPCTLLPYDENFEMGATLKDARRDVPLNHVYCATFCVLGGGSCSA